VLCSRVSRSSVPSSIPPRERGQEDGMLPVPLTMLVAELVRRVGGSVPAGEGSSRE
jgi:hypothetical protein